MKGQKTAVISIISGKGGTGKTLLTAVLGRTLADQGNTVLLVDLDIFVRGLTILLSKYTQKATSAGGVATVSELLIAPENSGARPEGEDVGLASLAVSRFGACDFLPATEDIGEPLDYNDQLFTSIEYNRSVINRFISMVKGKWDFVLLDCRSGIDSNIISICTAADFVISVAEDDDVCLQANANLINHLRYREGVRNVFTLINKGRRIASYSELQARSKERPDFNYMGVMPFDIEIMDDFGKERFWHTVYETLYFRGLLDAWNYFAERNDLGKLNLEKYRFPARVFMGKRSGGLSLLQRMLRVYGLLFSAIGVGAYLYKLLLQTTGSLSTIDIMVLASLGIGAIALLLSSVNVRRILLGETDEPK